MHINRLKRKPKRALPALTLRIAGVVLVLWLACMYAITSVTAESLYITFWDMSDHFMNNVWALARFEDRLGGDAITPPGYVNYVLWQATTSGKMGANFYILNDADHPQLLRIDDIDVESVIAVFDPDGNIIAYPSNFLSFSYFVDENNVNNGLNPDGYAVCVLDKQMHPETSRFWLEQNFPSLRQAEALYYRFTGVLEGGYLTVQEAAYYSNPVYTGDESSWVVLAQPWNDIAEDAEVVTLYAEFVISQKYEESRPFRFNGQKFNSLGEYMESIGPQMDWWEIQRSFMDFVNARSMNYYDWSSWDGTDENTPELEYRLATAILASPWLSAMAALRNVYIVSFLIIAIGVLWLRRVLKWDVVEPLATVNQGIKEGWTNVFQPDDLPAKFAEPAELISHYEKTKIRLSQNKDAISRLERAVDYAREAEDSRRQLTSNIAHELKTPLAVIHSYAEGLSERIAEDKRDSYLGVIMSETGRMNDMVMEMLDLSRLEAGKVKLAREDFSLADMAASVFGRLERAVEAKNLTLTIDPTGDSMVNADPSRIEQVITNFAVNAVKYTPFGGNIRVRTTKPRNSITFSVENDSQTLSSEALSKVWESFYSADESRGGSGTGLGLAIAKSIIELHGGTCFARNTKTGVEFSFTLE